MATDPLLLALRLLGQDLALEPGRDYLVGSGQDCDLRLADPAVAPNHARLRVGAGEIEIFDLGSAAGTWRNGARIEHARLDVGDTLLFGATSAILVRDDGQALIVPIPAMVADAVRRRRQLAVPAGPVRRPGEQGFQDLMADELRRAPWLGLSVLLHALLLLLMWLLFPAKPPSGDALATVAFDVAGSRATESETDARTPEVVAEPEPEIPITLDEPIVPQPPPVVDDPPEPEPLGPLKVNPRLSRRPDPTAADTAKRTSRARDLTGIGSDGFQKTVAELQRTGLEIVFVFDSTGSMGGTIRDTKNTITEMLGVLRALVPDARVGLVTYRDRGRDEDYLVRQVPLGHDFWQASNFVQNVTAEGGGDRPEAVRDGLLAAFRQPWTHGSKRVVVLAGDAPPHHRDWQRLIDDVKAFTTAGNSHVHTMVTSPRDAGRDTHEQFGRIARAGNGDCLELDQRDHVMQRVLDFAFGRQFEGDIAAVRKTLAENADRTETWALDLSRRGGSDLESALREQPVDQALLNALVRLPKRTVVEQLVRIVTYERTPSHTRQAVAWVLQRVFDLPLPPVDPITGEPASQRAMAQLAALAKRLPE